MHRPIERTHVTGVRTSPAHGARGHYTSAVHLTGIELTNFRSYRALDLTLGPGLTIVHGVNGSGKSNLLEAAYLLAIGKSYRASVERELVSWPAAEAGGYAIVGASVERADGRIALRVGFDCAGASGIQGGNGVQKRIRVNGIARRVQDLVGTLSAVLFTAEDIELIFGSPSGRRRYLDIMLSQLGGRYVDSLSRYQRVLTQRNALLRAIREGRGSEAELAYWDESLCNEGAAVLGARFDAMADLRSLVADAFVRLEAVNELDVSYVATAGFDVRPTPQTLADALDVSRGAERGAGMTLVGPHRDDLKLVMNGVEMAKHASRGQARLAALSLRVAEAKLLEARRGDPPVVLFDDVLSELDDRRRDLVLDEAVAHQQAIVTTADLAQVPAHHLAAARRLRVDEGEVVEEVAA